MAYNKETKMYEGYIYIILNDINPEKVYIGQTTTNPYSRWKQHIRDAQKNNHIHTDKIHNAMKLYGIEHFAMEVIADYKFTTKKELIEILNGEEKRFIKKYNSYYKGYNSTKGGRDDLSHQKRAVSQYDLYGNYIKSYESINDLLEFFDVINCIYECCSGKCKYAYGYIWRYQEDDINKYELPTLREIKEAITRIKTLKPIIKYDYKGNYICSFPNLKEASQIENIKYSRIYKCCTGQNRLIDKYVYRFEGDNFNKYPTQCKSNNIIEQYDLNGKFINYYQGQGEAERATGVSRQAIGRVCRGDSVSGIAGGYRWKYA